MDSHHEWALHGPILDKTLMRNYMWYNIAGEDGSRLNLTVDAKDNTFTGYLLLLDLYNYPIDFVKVEREIVLNAMEERGKMLLNGLVNLARSMNIQVLCEGVESEEQNRAVLSSGCDYIQGYYYSHVLPRREAERYLKIQQEKGTKLYGN